MIFLYLAIALVVGCIFGFFACGLLSEGTINDLRARAEFYRDLNIKLENILKQREGGNHGKKEGRLL